VGATAAVSGLALLAVLRVPMPPPAADPGAASLLRTVWSGVRHLATTPALRSITIATTLAFAGFGALPVAFPLLAEELGASRATGGLLFSVFALGALAGSVLVAARSPRTGPMRVAYLCLVGIAGAWAAVALAPTLPVAVVLIFVAGALEGPVLASTLAVRELHSPAAMRTQIVTTAASLKFGAFALGSGLAGAVAAAAGPRAGLGVASGAAVLGVVAGLLSARGLARRRVSR
jgi:MFS family permease